VPTCGWLLHPASFSAALEALLEATMTYESWDIVRLAKLPASSPLRDAAVSIARQTRRRYSVQPSIETPVIPISEPWEAYLKKRSASFRKHLRKNRNRFNRADGTVIDVIPASPNNTADLEARMSAVSKASWKRVEGTDLARDAAARRFIRHLLTRFGAREAAEVWFAYQGDRPIAYELHLRQRGTTYPLRADFDESYGAISPGAVLEAEILRRLFEAGDVHTYYSCGTTYRYLMRWTDQTARHEDLEVFSDALPAKAAYHIEYSLIPVARNIRGWFSPLGKRLSRLRHVSIRRESPLR
jgi:CelD/BcsL family acetyltransferase involved in cellulose biosynthesis